jgi:hypothetical protein
MAMVNPFTEVNWSPGLAEKRKFALSLVIGFPCLALALLLVKRWTSGLWVPAPSVWIGGLGSGTGVLLWLLPALAKPFYIAWYFLACCIGIVVSNVLLIGFFFCVVTPLGLMLRLAGRGSVTKSGDRTAASYWRKAKSVSDMRRYYRQF